MEAGAGMLTRMAEGSLDLALLITEPSAKSIEVTRRAATIIAERKIGPTLIVANRVRDDRDVQLIRDGTGAADAWPIPDDLAVTRADRDGRSPLDAEAESPAVRAVIELAGRLPA